MTFIIEIQKKMFTFANKIKQYWISVYREIKLNLIVHTQFPD